MLVLARSDFKYGSSTPHILAVINPCSGSGKATQIFRDIIEPIWRSLKVRHNEMHTGHKGQCTELLRIDDDITRYTSIVAIGGDGTLAEIIEGLRKNAFIKNAEKIIALGIIPVGSGNGLAKSLHFEAKRKFNVQEAAKMTASLATKTMDLFEMKQGNKTSLNFLAVTLGMIANTDIKSERWKAKRYLGEYRFILGAVECIWHNKAYPATLHYLPEGLSFTQENIKTLSGRFAMIMVANTSHCSYNAHTAPGAKINDGYLHIVVIGEIWRLTMLGLFATLEWTIWAKHPSVKQFKTKWIKIEGLDEGTIVTADGEQIPAEPLECRIQESAIQVLCSEVQKPIQESKKEE